MLVPAPPVDGVVDGSAPELGAGACVPDFDAADDEEDEDEAPDTEERGDGSLKVLPKQRDEFVCQSCFLVKHPSQLADAGRMYCRDCV